MIVDVKKVLFLGHRDDQERFFTAAQEVGVCEFFTDEKAPTPELTELSSLYAEALRILKRQPVRKQLLTSVDEIDQIAKRVVELRDLLEQGSEDKRLVTMEIARIAPLGNFSLEEASDLSEKTGKYLQYFTGKHGKVSTVPKSFIYLTTEHDMDYYVALSDRLLVHTDWIELHVNLSLSDLEAKLKALQQKMQEAEKELKKLSGYIDLIKDAYVEELNTVHLNTSTHHVKSKLDGSLFYVYAWVPLDRVEKIEEITRGLGVRSQEIAIEKSDNPPTVLRNEKLDRMGEDLVDIYDTPAKDDPDPSSSIIWTFPLFFAIIISDAGYGFLYLLLAMFIKLRFPTIKGSAKRVLNTFTMASVFCIVWGIMSASYFSIQLSPENPLVKGSLFYTMAVQKAGYHLDQKDAIYKEWVEKYPDLATFTSPVAFLNHPVITRGATKIYAMIDEFNESIFMELAILIGIVHLCFSFLRNLKRAWSGMGWVIFLVGGYLYVPSFLEATSLVNFLGWMSIPTAMVVGKVMMLAGFVLAILLTAIQMGVMSGVGEIFKIIQIFADVLSYLRLYALGLASMIMASTFNGLAREAGLFFGFFIILFGHSVNIALGTLAGVIHGLRLHFLEWYHYSFEGGGKKYNPLKKITTE